MHRARKAGAPPAEYLRHFALACHRADAAVSGNFCFHNNKIEDKCCWQQFSTSKKSAFSFQQKRTTSAFSLANECSQNNVVGALEPLYRLHASRLKLLMGPDPELPVIARHCFLASTAKQVLYCPSSTTGRKKPVPELTSPF